MESKILFPLHAYNMLTPQNLPLSGVIIIIIVVIVIVVVIIVIVIIIVKNLFELTSCEDRLAVAATSNKY